MVAQIQKTLIRKSKLQINEIPNGWNVFTHVLMCILLILCIVPIILVYSISFTSEKDLIQYGYSIIPKHISLSAYDFFLKTGDQIGNSYLITLIVASLGTILSLLVMSLFAYVLSRKDFKYRNKFSFFVFFTMLFNGGLVPSYIINVNYLHLNDTILALILPYTVNAFYLLVLRSFYSLTIPDSIIEAAKIDGSGEFNTFWKIVFPLSKPGLATIGLFVLVGYWNDWWLALLYITKPSLAPIQYVLMKAQNDLEMLKQASKFLNSADGLAIVKNIPTESGRMALTVIVLTPILFAYPFFQKYFVSGLTIGSIKG